MLLFHELGAADKRLVGKLVAVLAEHKLDGVLRARFTRMLKKINNPGTAIPKEKRANGCVEFYSERFPHVKEENKGVRTTDVAKIIGAEWQAMAQNQKDIYNKRAAQHRRSNGKSEAPTV